MKSIIKSFLINLVLLAIIFNFTLAGGKTGSTGATFLKLGIGARAASMGFSSVALTGDLSSLFLNPATLDFIKDKQYQIAFTKYLPEMNYGYIGASFPQPTGTIALGAIVLSSGKQTRTEVGSGGLVKTGEFTNMEGAIVGGYGARIYDNYYFGASVKAITQGLAEEWAVTYGLDFSLFTKIENADIGLAVRNLGGKMKFKEVEYDLPMQIVIGGNYHFLNNQILASLNVSRDNEENFQFGFGAEYTPVEYVFIRAGYRTGLQDVSGFVGLTAGLGLKYENIKLDYAYNAFGDLGDVHFIALSFGIK